MRMSRGGGAFAIFALVRDDRGARFGRGRSPSTNAHFLNAIAWTRDTSRMRIVAALVIALALPALAACHTYRDQLVRSQAAFERNDYERSVALLRNLESDRTK